MSEQQTLTYKESFFVKAYVKNAGNGAAAARDAGYKSDKGNERGTAYELLTKPHIIEAVEEATLRAIQAANLTDDDIRAGLIKESGLDGAGGPDDAQQGGRVRAIELLGKAQPGGGMFADKVITDTPVLSGIELILRLAQDGCPFMAVGACRDLGLLNDKTEQELRKVSPEAADELLALIPSLEALDKSAPLIIEGEAVEGID